MLTLRDLPKYEALLAMAERYPELDVSAVETCLAFLRTATDVHQVMDEHFDDYSLSMGKFTVLMLLYKAQTGLAPEDFLTPSECAVMAGVTKGTITGLLQGLERQGWIERQGHPGDRRRFILVLTQTGQTRLEAMLPQHFCLITALMSQLTAPERDQLRDLLQKLRCGTQSVDSASVSG